MSIFVKNKDFYQKTWRIALPVALQGMITIGINMIDTVMLGNFGEVQISASSLANQFTNIFHFICMGIGGGAAVMTARYWGRKDLISLKKTVTLAFWTCTILATIFTLAAVLLPGQIMRIYTPDQAVIEAGVRYFRFLAWTYLFHGLSVLFTQVLRSVGVSHIQFKSSVIAFFINIFFNWVFIFGKLGAPRLEIMGAAIGTLIARVFEAAFIGGYWLFREKNVGYRLRDFFMPCTSQLRLFLKYSMPVVCSDLLAGLGDNILSVMMGHISKEFVAANAITMLMVRLCTAMSNGISNAAANITGNTLGENKPQEAYDQGRTLIIISGMVGVFAGLIILCLRRPILSMYNINDETYAIAWQLMLAIAFILGFRTMGNTMTKGVLRGGGDTTFLLAGDVIFLYIVSIPLGYAAAFILHVNVFLIYVCFRAEYILKSLLCWRRFQSRKWIKKM